MRAKKVVFRAADTMALGSRGHFLGAPNNIPGWTNVYATWSNVLARPVSRLRAVWRGSRRMRIFSSALSQQYPWPLDEVVFPLVEEAPYQIEQLTLRRTE